MKLSMVKAMFGKVMAIGLVAGAVALVTPAKAQAEQFAIGVQFGQSYSHNDGRRDFYERERFERERAAIAQREAWERNQAYEQQERWQNARHSDRNRQSYGYADINGAGNNTYDTPRGSYKR